MDYLKRLIPIALTAFIGAVFIDAAPYKFTDHEKTQVIFGKLDAWATSLGFGGTFSHTGIFSQYVIGSVELLAVALLVAGFFPAWRALSAYGAVLTFVIMSGALFFHLFTPLGVDPNNDGGGLFMAAVLVWVSSIALIVMRREYLPFLPLRRG